MGINMNKRLYLRAFEYADLPLINNLRNNEDFYKLTCGNRYYISSERDRKWIEDKINNNYYQLYLMICMVEGDKPIGHICATYIDYVNRKSQWGGIVIAEEYSGKGYATEGAQLLLRHLFFELGMNMVYGFWRVDHVASLRMAEKIGFHKDGEVRDYVFKQNRFHNAYLMSLLKSEYNLPFEA